MTNNRNTIISNLFRAAWAGLFAWGFFAVAIRAGSTAACMIFLFIALKLTNRSLKNLAATVRS